MDHSIKGVQEESIVQHESNTHSHYSRPNSAQTKPTSVVVPKGSYQWQLLPPSELERIAYNSRKQQRQRIREHPPTCPSCPKAHFTSIAMLTTHLLSRKHLARVKSQAASLPDSTKRQRLELSLGSLPIPTEANDSVFKTKLGTTMDCATEDNPDGLESTSEGPPQYKSGQAPSGLPTQTAKQRRRKVERSRKKARARLCAVLGTGETHDTTQDRVATNSCLVASTGVEAEEKIEDVTSITSSDYTEDLTSNSAPLAASVSQDIHHAPGSDAIPSPHGVPSVSESTQVQVASPTGSIFRWHCSVCGSNWSRAKAWHGHLLSSQHLRRIERIMHKDVSPTVPYGRRDVLASSNPFGWGTCVGLVEEDEEEEEEQEVEQEYTASDLVSLVQEPDSEAADVPRNADQDDQGPDNDDMDLAD